MPRKKKQRPVDTTNVSTDTTHRASSQTSLTETEQTNAVSASPKTSVAGNGKSDDTVHDGAVDDVRVDFDDVVDRTSQQRRSRLRQHNVSGSEPFDANRNDTQDGNSQRPRARRTHRVSDSTELTSSARRK